MGAWANIVSGYIVGVLAQLIIFPIFGIYPTFAESLLIAFGFSVAETIRTFMFKWIFGGSI